MLLSAGVVLVGLSVHTYREQTNPVGQSFSLLLALLGATAFCLGITTATGTPNKLIWLFTNLSIPLVLLAFAFNYYGTPVFSSRARAGAVVAPAVGGMVGGTLLILGTPAKTPGTEAPLAAVAAAPELVFEAATRLNRVGAYYAAGVVVVAVGIVALNLLRYDHLDTRLAALVAFIGAWPWVGNFLVPDLGAAFGNGVSLSVLAGGYLTSAVVAVVVVVPLDLLDTSPAAGNVGPERVLDSIDDAVLIVDDNQRILRVNAVACQMFGRAETVTVGQSLSTVVGESLDALETDGPTELETVDGIRQFEVTQSTVTDGSGFERGTALVMRDVTQRQTREQRLQVLNRVLRHNLRNNATTIIGRARLIEDGKQDQVSAEKIIETTENLVGVAESARNIEDMMATSATEGTASLPEVVETAVSETQREYSGVEVTTAVPTDVTADVSRRTLRTVLSELIENAAEHNDADEPIVVVSVDEAEDGTVTVDVSDNGPGIPELERAVLDAGSEDQLQHGSGLGLWAVHWGVTQMGGRLSISENDPRGSSVTLTVPAASPTVIDSEEQRVTA
jgi:PAS domain S-box-containing protein